jgi:hypothetical protein
MFPKKALKIGYLPVLQQSPYIFMFVINATEIKKTHTPFQKIVWRNIALWTLTAVCRPFDQTSYILPEI